MQPQRGGLLRASLVIVLAHVVLAVTAQQHGAMKAAAAAPRADAAGPDACVTTPTMANCSSFEYPLSAAAADLGSLCGAMSFMAACSVASACKTAGAGPDGDPTGPGASQVDAGNPNVCQPWQLVTTVCKLDDGMTRMSGCKNFNTMCAAGSKVPTCKATGLTAIPTSPQLNKQVRSICEEMTMDGCEKCTPSWQAGKAWASCDLLDVYSYLCYQMPDMYQCAEWHAMCKADPKLVFCYPSAAGGGSGGGSGGSGGSGSSGSSGGSGGSGGSGSGGGGDGGGGKPFTPPPVMKMYFFQEMPFYLLFQSWVPRTNADLAGAWLAIFGLGLLYEFLQMAYGRYEAAFWAHHAAASAAAAAAAHSARGMDLEVGGPLAEGVEGFGGARDAAAADGGDGGGCCAAPPEQLAAAKQRSCCAGGGGGSAGHVAPHASSSASSFKGGRGRSGAKGGPPARRAGGCLVAAASYLRPELVAMDLVRGVARFVLAGLAYLLMLAAMSFNVAIFFAVIAGVAAGSMLFGRWRWSSGSAEGYSHCGCGSS